MFKDKRKEKEASGVLRREYSALAGVYQVPLGTGEEVVALTPRGKCSLETGKWNSYYFPLAAFKKPAILGNACISSLGVPEMSVKAQSDCLQAPNTDQAQTQVHFFPETSQHWKTSPHFPYHGGQY